MRQILFSSLLIAWLSGMLVAPAVAGGFLLEDTGGTLDTARVMREIPQNDDGLIFIGDMAFEPRSLQVRGFAGRRWPGGVVPIGFHSNVSKTNQDRFFDACSEWAKAAAVRCIERTVEKDWIRVESGSGNWSMVGRIDGMQRLQIFNWQWRYIIAHEIGHALGLGHEQQRPDRNSFVEIILDAIPEDRQNNFRILPMRTHTPYDFGSVMHYHPTAFGLPNPLTGLANTTIRPRPDFADFASAMGQRERLSSGDKAGMQAQYGAPVRALSAPQPLVEAQLDRGVARSNRSSGQSGQSAGPLSVEVHPTFQANAGAMAENGVDKIFGGEPVEPNELPDVVGVAPAASDLVECTGTLVAPDLVVTARHCVCDGISGRVMVGSNEANGVWHEVSEFRTVGEACGPLVSASNPDVAVLHLKAPITNVEPRLLASRSGIDSAKDYTVAGFGFTEDLITGVKHEANVPSASNDCTGDIGDESEAQAFGCLPDREIVAGRAGLGRDSCNGDSGGPLFLLPSGSTGEGALRLAGVTSRATANSGLNSGLLCGDGGIYVRITPKVREFIFKPID